MACTLHSWVCTMQSSIVHCLMLNVLNKCVHISIEVCVFGTLFSMSTVIVCCSEHNMYHPFTWCAIYFELCELV